VRHDLAADLRLLRPRTRMRPFTQTVLWVAVVGHTIAQTLSAGCARLHAVRTCYVPMRVSDRSLARSKSRSEAQTTCCSLAQVCKYASRKKQAPRATACSP